MASASSGIGNFYGAAASDPAAITRPGGVDTQTLLILAAAAVALMLLMRK